MINWREGKAGFVGAAKQFIKGFFNYSYTVTSADIETEPSIIIEISEENRIINISAENRIIEISEEDRIIVIN